MRLIDLNKLPHKAFRGDRDDLVGALFAAPTVDAVPVVRCRDCKYWITNNYYHSCGLLNIVVNNGDFFCAGGECEGGDE